MILEVMGVGESFENEFVKEGRGQRLRNTGA